MTKRLVFLFLLSCVASCQQAFKVQVADQVVSFCGDQWKPMYNEWPFAENFESVGKRPDEEYEQVVTVFKVPMKTSDQIGIEVAAGEFVEFFNVHNNHATVWVRLRNYGFWLQSRRTFKLPSGNWPTGLILTERENREFMEVFDGQVTQTRFELHSLTARRPPHCG